MNISDQGELEKKPTVKKSSTTAKDVKSWFEQEKFLCHILKLVAVNSDFLTEQRLRDLLQIHSEDEKTLITLDIVFTVSIKKCIGVSVE